MTALDDWIAELEAETVSLNPQDLRSTVATAIAALQLIQTGTTPGQIPGTNTNDNAAAGNVGEFISSTVLLGGAVALTTNQPKDITSIALTPGDWDVFGSIEISPNAATVTSALQGWISQTSVTLPTSPNNGGLFIFSVSSTGKSQCFPVGMQRISLATNANVFLSTEATFTTNVNSAFGFIGARRAR